MEKVELNQIFEQMLISAERYACGRRTYIVGDTIDYITTLLPRLSDWCINVMQNDMESEFGMVERSGRTDVLGDKCDYDKWVKFRDALNKEMEKRDAD